MKTGGGSRFCALFARTRIKACPVRFPASSRFLRSLFLLALFLSCPRAHSRESVFERVGLAEGLSNTTATSICQDRRGFLWFGTMEGLNRYDGYTFTVFRHDPGDSTSIGSSRILALHEDRSGILWVGTENRGLDRFDPSTGRFSHFLTNPADSGSISGNRVEAICEDRAGNLWIGTPSGLNRLDRRTGVFHRYIHDPGNPASLAHNHIGSITEDRAGNLWIGAGACLHRFDPKNGAFTRFLPAEAATPSHDPLLGSILEDHAGDLWAANWGGGLWKLDPKTGRITVFRNNPRDPSSLCNDFVGHLSLDTAGNLWIGTMDGLELLRKGSAAFIHHRHQPEDLTSISGNAIWPLFLDRSGVLWIGTYRGGLNKMAGSGTSFVQFRHDADNPNSLNDNSVNTVYGDRAGNVWAGTFHGLNRLDPRTGAFTIYPRCSGGLNADIVNAVLEDSEGVLWIGASEGGLNRLDPRTGEFRYYRANPTDPKTIDSDWVYQLADDGDCLWVGTHTGLNRFDRKTGRFSRIPLFPGESDILVRSLLRDRTGWLWIGTDHGLLRYHPPDGGIIRYSASPADSLSITDSLVRTIMEDDSGDIWIGTAAGLNRFDRKTGTFTHYTRRQGLANEVINSLAPGPRGTIWMCTNTGLSRIDPRTGSVVNYGAGDGIPFQTFEETSLLRARDGHFYVGGQEGLFRFNPDSLKANGPIPPVVITAFRVFDRERPLGRPVWDVPRIVLTSRDAFFSFEFAALDYTAPERNQYAYRMEGFDREWINSGARRYASYTSLEPGRYTFRVRGANRDGVWNERGAEVEIVILPPFWATWWFRSAMVVLALGGAWEIHRQRTRAIIRQREHLQTQVTERTREVEEKKDQLERSERLYRGLVETSPDGILITDTEGVILMANHRTAELMDIGDASDLTGQNAFFFLIPEDRDRFASLRQELLGSGILRNVPLALHRHPGESLPIELNALAFLEGDRTRFMGVIRDISERKRAERAHIERERMRGIIEIAGGACHEMNQPLQVISGYVELLSMQDADDSRQREFLSLIRQETARMRTITAKLNNITEYRTRDYPGGIRIIDLDRAASAPPGPEEKKT